MKRSLIVAAVAGTAMLAGSAPASAANPHFVRATASLSGANLTVSFKEAGLGANQLIVYRASADATATYVCVNNGGANPSARNKTSAQGPVSASGSFSSGKNGSVSASLTLRPPSAGGFSCPPGQTLRAASVSYRNVTVSDVTNGVSRAVSGSFSTGCLLPQVRNAC